MGSSLGYLGRGRRAAQLHAAALDVLVAVVLTSGALAAVATLRHDRTVALTAIGAGICTTAVAWRRLAPVAAAMVALAAVVVYQISGQDTNGAFVSVATVLTLYITGRSVSSRLAVTGLALLGLGACTSIVVDEGWSPGKDALTWLPLVVLPLLAGMFVTRREAALSELERRRTRLQDERDLARSRAVVGERTRIARELHDVVAHCVSVMVIQAGAARLLAATDGAAAREAMRVVVASGRSALIDLRRVVGVRRRTDSDGAASAPGLAQLPPLVARVRESGHPVHLHLDARASLPPDIDLAVFRIVQEALTNVRKHAPTASVEIRVTATADAIDILVEDGGPASGSDLVGSGNGLIGMRERVALHAGELQAGPTAAGGFAVRARLAVTSPQPEPAAVAVDRTGQRTRRQLSRLQSDALVSLGWLIPLEIEAVSSTHRSGPLTMNALAVAAIALTGVFRRRVPLTFLVVVGAVTLALSGGIASPQRASVVGLYTLVVGSYTVAAYLDRRRAVIGLALVVTGAVVTTLVRHTAAGSAFGGASMALVVWCGGRIARNQRELMSQLREASRQLAADRDARALIARSEERVRIARDLHVIVAAFVTTMVVRAEAVDELLTSGAAETAEMIASVEQTGREALAQLRQILGVLRNDRDPAPRRPQLDDRTASELLSAVPS